MRTSSKQSDLVVGLNIPAKIGMDLSEVATPALIIELDAFERNVATFARTPRQSRGSITRAFQDPQIG